MIDRDIEQGTIPIKVKNEKFCSDAINLNIEVCSVSSDDTTKHLKIDKDDFIILATKQCRIFKAYWTFDNPEKLEEGYLRIRVHATHSYSGFGKAFEQKFKYDKANNRFVLHNE